MRALILSASALALLSCTPAAEVETTPTPPAAAATNTDRTATETLNAWFAQRFEEELQLSPERMAGLGRRTRNTEWNDESKSAWLERMDRTRADLDYLRSVDVDALDADARLSHQLYLGNAERALEGMDFYGYSYPFNQMFGTHSAIPTFLLNQHKLETEDDARAFIARLQAVPEKLDEVTSQAQDSFERGIYPPKFVYAKVLGGIDNVLSGAPFDDSGELNVLLSHFQTKVDAMALPEATREALFTDAITAMQTRVGPSYEALRRVMEDQQSSATTDDGAWKLPNGADYYAYRLRMMTTTDLSPDDIHEIGLKEVARIHDEMRSIIRDVRFDGSLNEFFDLLRTDPQFFYPNTEEGKARYLSEATAIIDTMRDALPTVFEVQPKAPMEVRAVEPFREAAAGKAFYNRPAADGSRPGYYYANLYDMARMPIYQMEALAYHEGLPGHHMQIALAQELEGVPEFRKYGRYTAYTEGWGLYSEYLPKEMGFYQDPYSDFGRLAMELWRAGRLVVDTGLHHKRWTREEAIDYLAQNTPNPQGDIVNAIERYIVMPGQATAYMIGKIKILELREDAKDALGDDFDIREFHQVVLETGPVPLDVLETRVNAWVERTK